MKRIACLFVVCALLFTTSCTKKNNNANSGIWNIGSIQYGASVVQLQGTEFTASNGLNAMHAYFATVPTVTANYKIVDENRAVTGVLAAGEIAISFNVEGTDTYLSTGTSNDSASVAIEGGIMTIKVSPTPVQHYAGGPALDVNIASGVIKTNSY